MNTKSVGIENENTALTVTADGNASLSILEDLKNPNGTFFCSIVDDGTRKSKVAIYNAVNNAEDDLASHINEVLEIVDVAAYPVELTDEVTGEIFTALRTVLIDKTGKAYSATSQGIANSLQRVFSIIGMPSWTAEPVKMKIKQVQTRNGMNKVNIIELV